MKLKPTDTDKLKILQYRVEWLSYDKITLEVPRNKPTVIAVVKWFKSLTWKQAVAFSSITARTGDVAKSND